ncbi:MAG: hypothetical protein H7331_10915 [Bacteroidia bacterium]|nr:hypothetical protein [Bacteroidia bacterium]
MKAPAIFKNSDNENSEYTIKVDWLKAVVSTEAKWKKSSGLFTSQLIKASLQGQPATLQFLQSQFDIDIVNLLKQE